MTVHGAKWNPYYVQPGKPWRYGPVTVRYWPHAQFCWRVEYKGKRFKEWATPDPAWEAVLDLLTQKEHEAVSTPKKPSTAAIRAAENAETTFRDVYDTEERLAYSEDRVRTMLIAAYEVDGIGV